MFTFVPRCSGAVLGAAAAPDHTASHGQHRTQTHTRGRTGTGKLAAHRPHSDKASQKFERTCLRRQVPALEPYLKVRLLNLF